MFYAVTLQAVCTCLVEADSEQEANEIAWDEAAMGAFSIVESETRGPLSNTEANSYRRHAEIVLEGEL